MHFFVRFYLWLRGYKDVDGRCDHERCIVVDKREFEELSECADCGAIFYRTIE